LNLADAAYAAHDGVRVDHNRFSDRGRGGLHLLHSQEGKGAKRRRPRAAPIPLTWSHSVQGEVIAVRFSGHVTPATAEVFRQALAEAANAARARSSVSLRVDLSQIETLSSVGLKILVGLRRDIGPQTDIVLTAPPPVREVLAISRVDRLVRVVEHL